MKSLSIIKLSLIWSIGAGMVASGWSWVAIHKPVHLVLGFFFCVLASFLTWAFLLLSAVLLGLLVPGGRGEPGEGSRRGTRLRELLVIVFLACAPVAAWFFVRALAERYL